MNLVAQQLYTPISEYTVLSEDRKALPPGVIMRVSGKSQMAEVKNENGRLYRRSLWEKVLADPRTKEQIRERRMVGKLGHPKDEDANKPEDLSHVVTEAKLMPDGRVDCTYDVLDTPHGHIAATLFRAKVGMGTSSRGKGSTVNENGTEVVNENDFELKTWDFVLEPSTPGAYPKCISEEKEKAGLPAAGQILKDLVSNSCDTSVLHKCVDLGMEIGRRDLVEHAIGRLQEVTRSDGHGEGEVMPIDLDALRTEISAQIKPLLETVSGLKQDVQFVLGAKDVGKKYVCEACKKEFVRDGKSLPEGGAPVCPHCQSKTVKPVQEEAVPPASDFQSRCEAAERLLSAALSTLSRYKMYEVACKAQSRIIEAFLDTINARAAAQVSAAVARHVKPEYKALSERLLVECRTKKDVRRVYRLLSETGAIQAAAPASPRKPALAEKKVPRAEFAAATAGLKGEPKPVGKDDPGDVAVMQYKDATGKVVGEAVYRQGQEPEYQLTEAQAAGAKTQIAEGLSVNPLGANMVQIETDKALVLFSYRTPVAYQDKSTGKFYRTEKKWSVTTSSHINKWLGGAKAETVPQATLDRLLDAATANEQVKAKLTARINEAPETPPPEPEPAETGKTGEPGSISYGTLRPQDLIPRFLDALEELDPPKAQQIKQTIEGEAGKPFDDLGEDDDWWYGDTSSETLDDLIDALGDHAPAGHYFGAHEGDGADFGFWPTDEKGSQEEAKQARRQRTRAAVKQALAEEKKQRTREPLPGKDLGEGVDTVRIPPTVLPITPAGQFLRELKRRAAK